MKLSHPETLPLQQKFVLTRDELSATLIERDSEVDLVLTALIAQEHVLLVSPPGCAKSLLLESLMTWMVGKRFSALLTKFTQPEELFGPISLSSLKEDRYCRVTTGKLPEADVAFLDEIFKASSAILNTLLRLLNERTYDNGNGIARHVPLRLCVAASNEWPSEQDGGRELAALTDRFLLRKEVRPIASASGRQRLLWHRDHTPRLSTSISPEEVDQANTKALALPWTVEAKEAFETILTELAREGIRPGDRRQYKSVAVCQAYAYLCGSTHVEPEHLEILAHTLWDAPEEQPAKVARVVAKIANPTGMRINQLLLEVEQILAATDVSQLAQAATATAKLAEIEKQLATLKGDARLLKARAYVRDQIRKIKVASIEAV